MQEENGRKSSTREFLSFVPTACFEATTMKVADIFFNLWKKEKKPKKGEESLSQRPKKGVPDFFLLEIIHQEPPFNPKVSSL